MLLPFVAMPFTYRWGLPQAVRLGMTHGLLFLAYMALRFRVRIEFRWSKKGCSSTS